MQGPADWLCHGAAERCFAPGGAPMVLCARCVGMHIGFIAGVFAGCSARGVRGGRGAGRGSTAIAAVAVSQMVALGLVGLPASAWSRAASGLAFGIAIGWWACPPRLRPSRAVGSSGAVALATLLGVAAVAVCGLVATPNWIAQALPVVGLGALAFAALRAAVARPGEPT